MTMTNKSEKPKRKYPSKSEVAVDPLKISEDIVRPDPRTGRERERRFVTVIRAEKWWIEQARENPNRFIEYVTGLAPAKHHRIWTANIFDFNPEHKKFRLNIIAPRESAKTTITVYDLAWYIARWPLKTNAIVSVSAAQAEKRLSMIRDLIEHDPRFQNVFPWIHVDMRMRSTVQEFSVYADAIYDPKTKRANPISYNVWRSLVTRKGSTKDPTMFVSGAGGKGWIGRRISGILLLDDIIDESTMKDTLQDEMEAYIMRTLVPCLQEGAKGINIGTRWMINDIPERLKNNPEWHTIEIQAIRKDENDVPSSYWPEFWPLPKLENRRREMNNDALFRVMYLNDPTGLASSKFEAVNFTTPLPNPMPALEGIYIGVDLAVKTKQQHDWSVFSAVGHDKDYNFFLLDMLRIKATPDQVVKALANFSYGIINRWRRLDNILIEDVAFQVLLKWALSEKYPDLPAEPVPPIGDKGHRTEQYARLHNENRFFYNQEIRDLPHLKAEAVNFPLHAHDDTLDSISIVTIKLNMSIMSASVTMVKSPFML